MKEEDGGLRVQSPGVGWSSVNKALNNIPNTSLTEKLGKVSRLDDSDKSIINDFFRNRIKMNSGTDLIISGKKAENAFVLIEGWAYRYKILANGRRQIISYLLPGDICDIYAFVLRKMDHSIGLLTDATIGIASVSDLWTMLWSSRNIGQAFFRSTIIDECVIREHVVRVGRRNALQRLSHLLCELWVRLKQVNLVKNDSVYFPINQDHLADALGLTSVHLNRTLQVLRSNDCLSLSGKTLRIYDWEKLQEIAEFDASYLSIDEMPQYAGG